MTQSYRAISAILRRRNVIKAAIGNAEGWLPIATIVFSCLRRPEVGLRYDDFVLRLNRSNPLLLVALCRN